MDYNFLLTTFLLPRSDSFKQRVSIFRGIVRV